MFDNKASQYHVQSVVQNWTAQPYARGAYMTDSDSGAIDVLAEPIDGRVFFAGDTFGGENTMHGAMSTVHRAMEPAYGAVERVLRDCG